MGNFENLRLFFEIKINPLSIKSTSIVYNVEASVRANGEMQKKISIIDAGNTCNLHLALMSTGNSYSQQSSGTSYPLKK
jgi:hypothetical protein